MKHSAYSPKIALKQLLIGTSVAASVFAATTVSSHVALADDSSTVLPDIDTSTASSTTLNASDQITGIDSSLEEPQNTNSELPPSNDDLITTSGLDVTQDKNLDSEDVKDPQDSTALEPKAQSLPIVTSPEVVSDTSNKTIDDGVYTIGSYGDATKVVESTDTYPSDGANVQINTGDNEQNQRWKITYNQDRGFYSVLVNGTTQALTIEGSVAKSGANVYVSTDTKSLAQLWKILQVDGGYRFISALNNAYVLDITYGSATNGANMELWESNGNPYSQTFKLTKAMNEVVAKDSVTEGIYALHANSSSSNYVVAATNNTSLATKSNATNQRIYIQDAGNGFYRLIAESDGGAFAVAKGSTTTGASLAREYVSSSPNQLWAAQKNSDGSYTFINKASGQVLDIYGGVIKSGTTIGAWIATGNSNQRFFLEALSYATKGSSATLISDGSYYISSSNAAYQLAAKEAKAGSAVTLAAAAAVPLQTWQFSRISGSDYYTIGLSGTALVLDAAGATPANESSVIVWEKTGGINQNWKLVKTTSGYSLVNAMRPDLVLDLRFAQIVPGATVQTYTAEGTAWQSFNVRSASTDVDNRVAVDEGLYTFVAGASANSGYVLDIPGASKAEGTSTIIYSGHDSANQKFLITSAGNNYYYIVNAASGLALDADGAGIIAGTKVIQWHGNSGVNQQWAFVKNSDGSYKVVNRLSGLVLDIQYGIIANSSNVSLYYDRESINQKWWLSAANYIADGIYKITSTANANLVWDVPGLSSASGAQLALYTDNNQLNQRYQIIAGTKAGTYRIRSGSSGGYLTDVSGNVQQVGSSATAETSTALWKLGWNGRYITFVNVGSGKTLTAGSGVTSGSKLVTSATKYMSDTQAFSFSQATLLTPGYTYTFVNKATGGSLTSEDGSIKNATNVVTSDNSTSSFAKFTVGTNTDGSLTLANSISRLLVDVSGGALTSGTNVILYTANGGPNQAWTIEIGDGGGLILRNVNSKLSLAVDSKSDNNNVIQKTYDSDDAYQLWLYQIITSATRLNGIDISSWDKGLNVRGVEGDFVIVKSTEGTHYTNPYYKQQIADALAAGKLIGFYHYANGGDAVAEATYFYNSVKDYIGQAVLVLDWEGGGNPSFGKTDVSWSKTFLDTLYKLSGVRGLIYMSKSVTYAHNWSSVATSYPLWVAQYADMKTVTGYQTNPWTDNKGYGAWNAPTIFQYSSMGRPGGWNLSKTADLDVFYGSASDWIALARKH